MNIFYYSVHQILEDDEVRMFKSMGHNVFCLGHNFKDGVRDVFRPRIIFNSVEQAWFDEYEALGGTYADGSPDKVLPPGFVNQFDAVIVMHDPKFIIEQWFKICVCKVILRTIGQGIGLYERVLKPYRDEGLVIARYSPKELSTRAPVVRFGKDPDMYRGWIGGAAALTFSNNFQTRYPDDAADYGIIASRVSCQIGGRGNDGMRQSIGFVAAEAQAQTYRMAGCYLYIGGLHIPYTLNFIEAWMTGVPVVAYAPSDRRGRFYEIDQIIKDGVNGFVCRTTDDAAETISLLLRDRLLAERIGAAGRKAAIAHFSEAITASEWERVLHSNSSLQLPKYLPPPCVNERLSGIMPLAT